MRSRTASSPAHHKERSKRRESVAPQSLRSDFVVATVLAATLVAMTAGVLFFVGLLGVDVRLLLLIAPLFATTVLAGSVGLIVSSRYPEFTRFIIGSIPVVALFSLPLLSVRQAESRQKPHRPREHDRSRRAVDEARPRRHRT